MRARARVVSMHKMFNSLYYFVHLTDIPLRVSAGCSLHPGYEAEADPQLNWQARPGAFTKMGFPGSAEAEGSATKTQMLDNPPR